MNPRHLRQLPLSRLTGPALHAGAQLRLRQWSARAANPEPVARQTLKWLGRRAEATAFGRTYAFKKCRSYEELRQAVPLRTYADFVPWLSRMRAGECDVLWPGRVRFFALSGGTTLGPGGFKYLPVSDDQLDWQRRAAFDAVAQYLVLAGERALTRGFALGLVPPLVIKQEGAVGVSSNPALLLHHAPKLSQPFALPKQPVAGVEDFEARLTALAQAYLDHDVRLIAGTPCWFAVFFDKVLAAARARGLGATTVRDVWPHLRGLITGGASPAPYAALFKQQLGDRATVVNHFNSTEAGLIACATTPDSEQLQVVPDRGVFYEFVRTADLERPNPRRVPLWEVEPEVDYAVYLWSPSGLFAYALGDVVRFSTCFPHRLKVMGRVRGGLSPAHECTTESMVEAAVLAACSRTGSTPFEFTAAADAPALAGGKSRYRLFIEFARPPAQLDAFTEALDAELTKQNHLYGMYRAGDVVLLPPEVVSLTTGATSRFMDALGPRSVQQKFPRTLDARRRAILEHTLAH